MLCSKYLIQKRKLAALSLSIALFLTSTSIFAETSVLTEKQQPIKNAIKTGYSYFNIGVERVTYEESPATIPVYSKADVTNPVIRTGGLYAINDNFNFSIDATATFAPEDSMEDWVNSETSEILQNNIVTLQTTNTLVLGHYKFASNWQLLAGGSFNEEEFKRFKFKALSENVADLSGYTVEESIAHIDLHLGVGYGSDIIQGQGTHFSARAIIGTPLWSRTKNTSYPDVQWSDANGYNLQLQTRYSVALSHDFHIGAFLNYSYTERNSDSVENTYNDFLAQNVAIAELPDSETQVITIGLELLWQL